MVNMTIREQISVNCENLFSISEHMFNVENNFLGDISGVN